MRAARRVLARSSHRARCSFGFETMEDAAGPVLGVYCVPETARAQRRAAGELPHLLMRLRRALRSTGSSGIRRVAHVSAETTPAPTWWAREAL